MKPDKCPFCKDANYTHGSGLYDYYSCGHAFEKPLNKVDVGKWVKYPSPYDKVKESQNETS